MSKFSIKQPVVRHAGLVAAIAVSITLVAGSAGSIIAAKPSGNGEQSDSAQFTLHLKPEGGIQDVVYCGVANDSEPFDFKVAATNPPKFRDSQDPEAGPVTPSHDGAGWLDLGLQSGQGSEFNIPYNDSYSLALTLGGRFGQDQIVQLSSPPKGDETGGGAPITGFVSVKASKGATDPFNGDGRNDNYCLTLGYPAGSGSEYTEGQITTKLSVPDAWVVDGNGSDGGVLAAPH